jgi:hypothetical protein
MQAPFQPRDNETPPRLSSFVTNAYADRNPLFRYPMLRRVLEGQSMTFE